MMSKATQYQRRSATFFTRDRNKKCQDQLIDKILYRTTFVNIPTIPSMYTADGGVDRHIIVITLMSNVWGCIVECMHV